VIASSYERERAVNRALFPAKSEPEESRRRKMAGPRDFAREKMAAPGQEAWALK
jgi:hypothetical protein